MRHPRCPVDRAGGSDGPPGFFDASPSRGVRAAGSRSPASRRPHPGAAPLARLTGQATHARPSRSSKEPIRDHRHRTPTPARRPADPGQPAGRACPRGACPGPAAARGRATGPARRPRHQAVRGRPQEEARPAVDDVSLRIERGEVYGILGANGGGKSTLIRLVSTLLTLDTGRVEVFGHDVEPRRDGRQAAHQPGLGGRRLLQEAVALREPRLRRAPVRPRRRARHAREADAHPGPAGHRRVAPRPSRWSR